MAEPKTLKCCKDELARIAPREGQVQGVAHLVKNQPYQAENKLRNTAKMIAPIPIRTRNGKL